MGIKVGLQGYTVREYMRFDPLGALRKTAGIGYRYIELPNYDASGSAYYGLSAEEWKKEADAANISIIGGYVTNLTEENLEKTCAFFQKLGCSRLVIPIDYFPSRKILDEKCRFYNKAGNLCQKYGLSLYYENHYHEFQQMNGQTVMSLLLSQTDPELFHLSLNTYWLMRGLVDPYAFFRKYPDRIGSIVQEDYPLDQIDKFNMWNFKNHHPIAENIQYDKLLQGNEIQNIHPVQCELFTEIGEGILKLQPIIDLAAEIGNVSYVLLKQDFTRRPTEFESIEISLKNYRKIRGVDC